MKLQTKIISTVILFSIVLNLIFQSSIIINQKKNSQQQLYNKIETNSILLNNINSLALYNFQERILDKNIKSFFEDPEIQSISLKETFGEISIFYNKPIKNRDDLIKKITSIIYEDEIVGEVITIYTKEYITKQISAQIRQFVINSTLITIILSFVLFILLRFMIKPIIALTELSIEISNGNLDKEITINSSDEIGILSHNFMKMRDSIKEKIEFLNIENEERKRAEVKLAIANKELLNHKDHLEQIVVKRTSELQDSFDVLTETQKYLVESEKMASLGNLVAGIAHEINTPIGIGVTAASHLIDETENIATAVEQNTLTLSALKKYTITAVEGSQMILSNLNRAASQIKSFKQVAVDQSSDGKRAFQIEEYIEEILISTKSKFKRTQHRIIVSCDEDFTVNSYPGALSQILTNLLINSLIHGFENIEIGIITIKVKKENDMVIINYIDTGHGIPPDNLKKIFDPFFTTKRGFGGSGLGLNIVYNLVTQTLKGTISCESAIDKGVNFRLSFPCNI